MDPHVVEWLNLAVRWFHVITGIAWIGASFYFNWLENALNRKDNLRPEIAGNLWAIHGGGFYYVEKYKLAPESIPKTLHWFKWEAYFTWLSGFCLLVVVYYLNAKSYLIDPNVRELTSTAAIGIGIASLAAGWLIYEILCRSPLVNRGFWFATVGFMVATGFSYFLAQMFGARAAYIHVGAMLGTIMAANVFIGIIPSQKALVKAAQSGDTLDPQLGLNAGRRSLHNNYLTLPVVFIMISNHFPSTFGHQAQWAVLAGISLGGALIRHWFNLKGKGHRNVWIMPLAIASLLAVAIVTKPAQTIKSSSSESVTTPSFVQIAAIFAQRCNTCHSASPTDDIFKVPPNGVTYDTPGQIVAMLDKIKARAVDTETMPLVNKTKMTKEERVMLGAWIAAGAPIE